MTDKVLYQQVTEEFSTDRFDQALWAMVWTKAGGDESKAKARYVEARVREIETERKRARKAAATPLSKRIPWKFIWLFACAVLLAMINSAVSRAHVWDAPTEQWGFYLAGIFGYSLGLLAIPAFIILISFGHPWGFRVALLVLVLVACFAGAERLPSYYAGHDVEGAVSVYFWGAFWFVLMWLIYVFAVRPEDAP